MSRQSRIHFLFSSLIALVQIFDIIIHVAVNQVEPLRVSSNLVILLWVIALVVGQLKRSNWYISIAAIGIYLVLNLSFIGLKGITNPANGGALRLPLFILVGLTVIFWALLMYWPLKKE